MKNSHSSSHIRILVVAGIAALIVASLPLLSMARSTATMTTAVNIVNNSSREIRNVYLSHVDQDDWSDNQLGSSTIGAGQSYNLNVSTCDGQQVKVIGEDGDGCFVSTVVNCGASVTWTVDNDTPRDCGY